MKLIIALITFLFSLPSNSQVEFKYKLSKPYCVLNFMETSIGNHGTSKTLKVFIDDKLQNNEEFKNICAEFKKINLEYYFKRSEFPVKRSQNNSTFDLISMHAVNANNLEEFKEKCIGLIPLSSNQKLFEVLSKAEIIYDKIIWNEYKKKAQKQVKALSKYKILNAEIFNKFNLFYNSTWTKDIPFQVAIYPIPGRIGVTSATPHINSLCIGILTDEINDSAINGVILHEMCHILYGEQSVDFQQKLNSDFDKNKSPFSNFAYSYFNEALATALGNGWSYKKMNSKMDESEWYNDVIINDFAKTLYPLVNDYLEQDKVVDSKFIDEAIISFGTKFPNAIYEYSNLLNTTIFYSDAIEENEAVNIIGNYFNISSLNISSPILHPYSIESMQNSTLTQLIIIDSNQRETIIKLSDVFPEIKNFKFDKTPTNLSFIDAKGRAVIILILNNKKELNSELEKMKSKKLFDAKNPLQN
jgi:hypothetical protein